MLGWAGCLMAGAGGAACGPQGGEPSVLPWEACQAPFPPSLDGQTDGPICLLMGLEAVGQ